MLLNFIRTHRPLSFLARCLFLIYCTYPLVSTAQTCTTTQFSKLYQFEGSGGGSSFNQIPGSDNFYFSGAKNYNFFLGTTDNNGNLLWSKQYKFDQATAYGGNQEAAIDSNGNYFINLDANCIGLLNPNGDPITAKELKMPYDNVNGLGMGVLADNKKIILVNDQTSYLRGYMLLCLSADLSTIIWNKHFSGGEMYFSSITIEDNKIFVPGSWRNSGTLLCFDAVTGNLLSKKTFVVDNKRTGLEKVYSYNDGYIVQAKYYGGEQYHHLVFRLDKNLEVRNLYRFVNVSNDASIALAVEPGGDFYGAWYGQNKFYMTREDSVLWNYSGVTAGLTGPRLLKNTNEGLVLYSTGSWNAVGVGIFSATAISRSDANGRFVNCYTYQQPFQKVAMSYTTGVPSLEPRDTTKVTLLEASITVIDDSIQVIQNCVASSVCNTLKIKGITSLCSNSKSNFVVQRNTGCYTPVKWSITGGKSEFRQLNDSTISVQFLEAGIYTLIANLKTCQSIGDTMLVHISLGSKALNLGSDTAICKGGNILLNARKGYSSYLWQDGSMDSVFQVKQPGSYNVIVTDACGNSQRDTIAITYLPAIPFEIGPDRTKCNDDTIHIAAPPGFLHYLWSPAYHINSLTTQQVIVNPLTDTFYAIRAEKTPGCFVYDTVHVKVNTSPPIDLGPDTGLCSGSTLAFDAGNNFSSWQWSTGDTSRSITVDAPNQYSVMASSKEGCSSYDTVRVLDFFPDPAVSLDHNNNLCYGSSRILDAGNFSSYLWNDGSTGRTMTFDSIGSYSVIVTDHNGCSGSDVTIIDSFFKAPSDFLPADTAICAYETILVQSVNKYDSYLWSTNSLSPAITISQPGTYWLQATDHNNCSGKDTIVVKQKDCMKGFYMPDAFTPNRDGKNDVLRPLLFGNVVRYRFTVFTRSGQIVFQTSDPSKAWDGNHAGPQESKVFAWTCNYQFQGEQAQTATGSVVLIR